MWQQEFIETKSDLKKKERKKEDRNGTDRGSSKVTYRTIDVKRVGIIWHCCTLGSYFLS